MSKSSLTFQQAMKVLRHKDRDLNFLRQENERLQAEIERQRKLKNAVANLLASAQGGDYGEIVCDADDFAELEQLAKKAAS